MSDEHTEFSCIILAGGRGTRMQGCDKGLVEFRGRALIELVLDRVAPQVSDIVISANRNLPRYQSYGYPVVPDSIDGFTGPLAGIASALPKCRHDWVLVTPCDMPHLPDNLVTSLRDGRYNEPLVAVAVDDRLQLVFLLQRDLLSSINTFLQSGQSRVMTWLQSQMYRRVDFSKPENAFYNLNTFADLE
jgi:molybdopterin-guanine dinucleotide biosynthesis protein A